MVSQVLDELGLQMAEGLGDLPSTGATLNPAKVSPTKGPAVGVGEATSGEDDLQARLDNLRRD